MPAVVHPPRNGMDAVSGQRKGLKRYPFLPQAKKIQAESPVRPRKWPDAPKIKRMKIPMRLSCFYARLIV
jgi:hypothetical protein